MAYVQTVGENANPIAARLAADALDVSTLADKNKQDAANDVNVLVAMLTRQAGLPKGR